MNLCQLAAVAFFLIIFCCLNDLNDIIVRFNWNFANRWIRTCIDISSQLSIRIKLYLSHTKLHGVGYFKFANYQNQDLFYIFCLTVLWWNLFWWKITKRLINDEIYVPHLYKMKITNAQLHRYNRRIKSFVDVVIAIVVVVADAKLWKWR